MLILTVINIVFKLCYNLYSTQASFTASSFFYRYDRTELLVLWKITCSDSCFQTNLFSRNRSPSDTIRHLLWPDGLIHHLKSILSLLITLWFLMDMRTKSVGIQTAAFQEFKFPYLVKIDSHLDLLSAAMHLQIWAAHFVYVCVQLHEGRWPGECLSLGRCEAFLSRDGSQWQNCSVFAVKETDHYITLA